MNAAAAQASGSLLRAKFSQTSASPSDDGEAAASVVANLVGTTPSGDEEDLMDYCKDAWSEEYRKTTLATLIENACVADASGVLRRVMGLLLDTEIF